MVKAEEENNNSFELKGRSPCRGGNDNLRRPKKMLPRRSTKVLILIVVPVATLAYALFLPNFIYLVPGHHCQSSNSTAFPGLNQSFPANVSVERCSFHARKSNWSHECTDGWVYDQTHGDTIVSEFDLVCKSSWKRPLMQCLFMLGVMLGSCFGSLSDRYGRQIVIRVFFVLGAASLLALSFAFDYYFYLALIAMTGFCHIFVYCSSFVIAQECVAEQHRAFAALVHNFAFGLGFLILPLVAYFIRNWRWLIRTVAFASFACIPLLWQIDESELWLSQNKVVNRSSATLQDDGDGQESKIMVEKKQSVSVDTEKEKSGLLLIRNSVLRSRMLMICFLWNITYLDFYTLSLNSASLGGDIYLNCVFGALVDIASFLTLFYLLRKIGRRNCLSACVCFAGVFCLLTPPLKHLNEVAGIVSAMLGKFFSTTAMSTVILFTGELFPTLQRNTALGVASMSARVASALSPFLIFAGETIDLSIPFYVMGTLSIVGAFLTLALPETTNVPLPESLADAVALNKFRFRIAKKKNKTPETNQPTHLL